MKLPEGERAVIDRRKLTDYVLSPQHDDGRHKAKLFKEVLGINLESMDLLQDALTEAAATGEAAPGRVDRYGQRVLVDFDFKGPGGQALVRSVWIVRLGERLPRLVTCYIL